MLLPGKEPKLGGHEDSIICKASHATKKLYVDGHLITVGRGVSEEHDEIKSAVIDWRRKGDESQEEQELLSFDLRQPWGARKHSLVVG